MYKLIIHRKIIGAKKSALSRTFVSFDGIYTEFRSKYRYKNFSFQLLVCLFILLVIVLVKVMLEVILKYKYDIVKYFVRLNV